MTEPQFISVGNLGIICPSCEEVIPVEILASIQTNTAGLPVLVTDSDMTDLWTHMWTHPKEETDD